MTKVISLSETAYAEMKAMKQGDESFSDVVHRIAEKTRKKPLMAFFGKWPGPKEELDQIQKTLAEHRKQFKLRKVDF
jgi:predicted CopG family antitoxin